jgi:hypothetical protein
VNEDPRARRVAVVAEALLPQLRAELNEGGYGVIQLPPSGLPDAVAAEWLEQVAEHVEEFRRTGYEVVLADDGAYAHGLDLPQYAIQPPSTSRLTPET